MTKADSEAERDGHLQPGPRTGGAGMDREPARRRGARARERRQISGPRGFTLIELAVTFAIIGLVVGIALPAMLDLSASRDTGALEPARSLLVEARQASEIWGSDVEVVIVPTSGRYRVEERRVGSETVVKEGVLPLDAPGNPLNADRFRVVFAAVGMGVGDTLFVGGRALAVAAETGRIGVTR